MQFFLPATVDGICNFSQIVGFVNNNFTKSALFREFISSTISSLFDVMITADICIGLDLQMSLGYQISEVDRDWLFEEL